MVAKETERQVKQPWRTSSRMKALSFLYKVGQLRSHFSPQDSYGCGYSACLTVQLYPLHNPTSFPFLPQMLKQNLHPRTQPVAQNESGGIEATKLRGLLDVQLREMKESQRTPKSSSWCWVEYGKANSSGLHPKMIRQ